MRFPRESKEYRAARKKLSRAEIDLRKRIERVAELRRALPLGGEADDYPFEEGPVDLAVDGPARKVKLSKLFAKGKDSLVLYSFMYGPSAKHPCPLCVSILDSLDRTAPHATQRINLAIVAKSPLERVRAFARGRGWTNLRILSAANNDYQRDYGGETPDGHQLPALNVFVRDGERVRHFYNAELLYGEMDPGQDARHIDLVWPLWNLFDLTPIGRGSDWYPALSYRRSAP
jgi:predicted dithiol-disulfide oxidoreductase (DUF899 family)